MLEKKHDKYKLNSKCRILKAAFGHSDLIDMRNMQFEILKDLDHKSLKTIVFAKVNSGFIRNQQQIDIGSDQCVNK